MKKNSKSPTRKEKTSKRTRSQRPVQRETKEVLAELVEQLRGKLELKAMPASPGQVGQQPELRPNLDRLTVGVDLGDQCAHTKYPEIELSDENQSAKLDLRFGKKAGVLISTVTDADSGNRIDANVEFRCLVDPSQFVRRIRFDERSLQGTRPVGRTSFNDRLANGI